MVKVDHSESMAMCGVEMERSGEVELESEGSRVGESVLRRTKSESVRASCMISPRPAALVSLVCEYQAGWWALKSPRMRVSSWVWKSRVKEGV